MLIGAFGLRRHQRPPLGGSIGRLGAQALDFGFELGDAPARFDVLADFVIVMRIHAFVAVAEQRQPAMRSGSARFAQTAMK